VSFGSGDRPPWSRLARSEPIGTLAPKRTLAPRLKEIKFRRVVNVEPSDVHALKNSNPLKDVEALAVLAVAVLV